MDWSLIGAGTEPGQATANGTRPPGFGDFLLGQGKNIISRMVDMEFPEQQTFSDPVMYGKAESSGSVFEAGKATGSQVAGFNLSPMVMVIGGVLAISLLLVLALRK